MLTPLPAVVIVVLILWKHPISTRNLGLDDPGVTWKERIHQVAWLRSHLLEASLQVLTNGFKQKAKFWVGVSLYRRLFFVVASTMILDLNWKAISLTSLCFIFVITDSVFRPFRFSCFVFSFDRNVPPKGHCRSILLLDLTFRVGHPISHQRAHPLLFAIWECRYRFLIFTMSDHYLLERGSLFPEVAGVGSIRPRTLSISCYNLLVACDLCEREKSRVRSWWGRGARRDVCVCGLCTDRLLGL